jgi:hypothetical protein
MSWTDVFVVIKGSHRRMSWKDVFDVMDCLEKGTLPDMQMMRSASLSASIDYCGCAPRLFHWAELWISVVIPRILLEIFATSKSLCVVPKPYLEFRKFSKSVF